MKSASSLKRILSALLVFVMVLTLMPVHTHADSTGNTTYVLAGSDFQPTDYSTTTGVNLLNEILVPITADYEKFDGFLFAGDYDYGYTNSTAGKTALQNAIKAKYPGITHEVYVEGNHDCASRQGVDLVANGTLSPSGANDTDFYGVYVIHERDYMWASNGIKPTTIQETANKLESYLNGKRNEGYTKPIFVISHLPLHYSMRTVNDGDGSHANYIFDVLNEAGNAGLNIIFLFGHNHSNGWDDYLGGAAIYLAKGDKINIAQASRSSFKEETLAFTYMNAGYVSYYRNVNTGSETDLSMTVFEITDDTVAVLRYSKNGVHDVKSKGVANSYKNEKGYSPNTGIYVSPQVIVLNKDIVESGTEVTPPDSGDTESGADVRTYTRVTSTAEFVSGGKYLIIHNGQNDFMIPEVTSDGGTRIGFDLVTGPDGLGNDTINGEYQDYEWTFEATDGGWKIGADDGYMTLQTADSRVAAQLSDSGDIMVIGGSANNYTFTSATYSNGSYVLNYNSTGDLVNGYASNAATFYIYQLSDEGMEDEENTPIVAVRQVMSFDELKENVGYLIVADEGDDITLTNQVNGSGLLLSGSVSAENIHLWYLDLTNEYIRYGSPTGSNNFLKVTNGGASIGNSTNRVTEILDNGNGTFSLYRSNYYLNRYGGSTSTKAGGYTQNNSGSKWKLYEVFFEHQYETVTVEATCTTDGSVTTICTICGKTTVEVIPALGHNYKAVVTAPTCETAGYTTYTCACGDTYTADEVAALGHSYETVVTAPTCTETGYSTYTCACGDTYTADEVAALGHSYKAVVTAPTCETAGYTTYTCACGDTYTADEVAALGHNYKAVVTAPTCETAGYTTYTCTCGDTYTADKVAALGHSYETVITDATCTKEGSVVRTCVNCGESDTQIIPAIGHSYETVTVEATCTTDGSVTTTCDRCGDTTVEVIPALGHNYKAVVTAPTCETAGYTTYTCACGDTYTADEVAALGHSYKAVVTAPTCETAGYTTYTCDTCGDTYVADQVAALGHNYETEMVEATCETAGSVTTTCTVCGDSTVEVIPALGHGYETVITDATCTEEGSVVRTCSTCGDSDTQIIPARGHSYETVTVEATCTTDGSVTTACTVCGDTTVEVIPALGHNYNAVVTAPTCTTGGYTTYTCGTCGDTYIAEQVAALGHNYNTVVIAPACETAGYTTYTCACGDSYVADQVAALGHSYTTEETDGYLVYTCVHCGDSYSESIGWIVMPGTYVLDTDGVDVGSAYKYIVVGADKDYALTLSGSTIGAAAVNINGNTLTLDNGTAYEFYFQNNSSKENGSYLLTQDGTKGVYHMGGNMYYGVDNKGYWHIGSASNGKYQMYDYDNLNWYLNYGYVWGSDSVSRFAVSSTARYVRLFQAVDSYVRLSGDTNQTWIHGAAVTESAVLEKVMIQTSTDGSNVSGTVAVTADMISWDKPFDGYTAGTYTAEVTWNGIAVGTITVTVTGEHDYTTVVVDPTCTAAGTVTTTCTVCGKNTVETIAALGHSYTVAEVDGYMVYTCGRCGDSYSEKIAPDVTYDQVSAIASGNRYVITLYSGGTYYALSHAGNGITAVQVTVSGGQITSEITEDLLWTYEDSKLFYEDGDDTYYLYAKPASGWFSWFSAPTLSVSTTNSTTVSFSSSKLKVGSYYLRYSSGSIKLDRSSTTTYLFQENEN